MIAEKQADKKKTVNYQTALMILLPLASQILTQAVGSAIGTTSSYGGIKTGETVLINGATGLKAANCYPNSQKKHYRSKKIIQLQVETKHYNR